MQEVLQGPEGWERVTEGFGDTASKVVSDSDLERKLKNQLREPSKEPDRK